MKTQRINEYWIEEEQEPNPYLQNKAPHLWEPQDLLGSLLNTYLYAPSPIVLYKKLKERKRNE